MSNENEYRLFRVAEVDPKPPADTADAAPEGANMVEP